MAELRKRKRRRQPSLDAIRALPLPPEPPQPSMGFLCDISSADMRGALDLALIEDGMLRERIASGAVVPRLARSNRLLLDHTEGAGPLGGALAEGGAGDGDGDPRTAALERLSICMLKV